MLNNYNNIVTFPRWVSEKAVICYIALLVLTSLVFSQYMLNWYWIVIGLVEITMFWIVGRSISRRWAKIQNENIFLQRIFWGSFSIRMVYMLIMYFVFMHNYGHPFGFDYADSELYTSMAAHFADCYREGNFNVPELLNQYATGLDISDTGYMVYLSFVYYLTGNSVVIARIIKCIWSALTAIILYRLAQRNFGDEVARLAAIFFMLYSNSWYYCGVQLKETEMVFLSVTLVDLADSMFKQRKISVLNGFLLAVITMILFTFRTPLGLVAILSILFTIVLSSNKIINWGKRIIIGTLSVALIAVTFGNRLEEETKKLYDRVAGGEQQKNIEWRATGRENSNSLAKYAGAAVFAPLIFTLPFPTMVQTPNQEIQHIHQAGNFTKNIMSGLTIFAIFSLLLSGRWRKHLMPIAFTLGYLVVLTMSSFAQAERFHQPVQGLELMFAAYGIWAIEKGSLIFRRHIQNVNSSRYKIWFSIWVVFIFVAGFVWQWFKLMGRGMV